MTVDRGSAFARFLAHESAGGVVLAVAALLALALSNSPWSTAYESFLNLQGELRIGGDALVLSKPLIVWVNELWMAVFFFVVGLEIKREFVEGELSSWRQALLPAAAALGGMAVPALIYALVNSGDAVALRGWAIPAATDIAFTIGVCVLCGIGFTMSLFIGGLAFEEQGADRAVQVKLGVLGGSLIAATLGALILVRASARAAASRLRRAER